MHVRVLGAGWSASEKPLWGNLDSRAAVLISETLPNQLRLLTV